MMPFTSYCHAPLDEVWEDLQGDHPPTDPAILRIILTRTLLAVVDLKGEVRALRERVDQLPGSRL